jgi:hypothetical protein
MNEASRLRTKLPVQELLRQAALLLTTKEDCKLQTWKLEKESHEPAEELGAKKNFKLQKIKSLDFQPGKFPFLFPFFAT